MSEPFWFSEPSILFSKDTWYLFVPQPQMPVKTALNAVVRFSVYLAVLLLVSTRDPMYILFVPTVMLVTVFLEKWFPEAKKMSEGFQSGPVVSGYRGTDVSMPTLMPALAITTSGMPCRAMHSCPAATMLSGWATSAL